MTSGSHPLRPRRPRRGRGPLALLPLVLAGWALLEIWLLITVGDAVGGVTVFLLLLAAFLLGGAVVKRAGRRAWQRLSEGLRAGGAGAPAARARGGGGDGLTMLGGLLLMVPGFASDAVGLLCVFPPTAALLRRAGARYVRRRAGLFGAAFDEARATRERMRAGRPDDRVVRGEVVREDDDEPPGER
ncbi:FxsA family membrane protein [Streptomyces sp. NBC_01803]|uniref:FxsA family membrane protein n=1 Tax=Streptomyces sp. NBC_01803 TaxID=2975946 RepID=UPI002DDB1151|nr:FxsA family membrane protein [Streptomyces sp. NBC_01803]WSA47215.1 FxsA family protein [Streptomyces sp. NBC_01803]